MAFRQYLLDQGVEYTAEAVIEHIKEDMSETLFGFINNEKILNDVYRYYVLGERDFPDDHDFKNMVKIDFPVPTLAESDKVITPNRTDEAQGSDMKPPVSAETQDSCDGERVDGQL